MVQLLHSCGPLFKIIRVCGPQSAKNTYFRPKSHSVLKKKKKKSLHLESVSSLDSLPSARHALLYKVVAAFDRQDLCKIVPRAAQIPSAGP